MSRAQCVELHAMLCHVNRMRHNNVDIDTSLFNDDEYTMYLTCECAMFDIDID